MNVTTPFWATDPNWLEAIGTIGAVIVALLLAGGSFIWRHFKRPILEVTFDNTEPYCRTAHEPAAGTSYFMRLKITNKGKSTARHCVGKINRIIDPITLMDQENWDPVALQWVGHREGPIHINRGEYEFLELVTIRSDGGIYLREPHGIYRITLPYIPMKDYLFFISIYGENFVHKPITYKFISNREFGKQPGSPCTPVRWGDQQGF